jgi:hypothetical protein
MAEETTVPDFDYPAEFLHQFRVELWEIARDLGRLEASLPGVSVAERRSIFFRAAERFEQLGQRAIDAAGLTRDHVTALTLQLKRRNGAI